ncbi:hypothetical protein GCM10010341_90930 [Streptomyces noursei]|nr:hypothetical protein GCM10010341_90930 [Streptomyces noursei]
MSVTVTLAVALPSASEMVLSLSAKGLTHGRPQCPDQATPEQVNLKFRYAP